MNSNSIYKEIYKVSLYENTKNGSDKYYMIFEAINKNFKSFALYGKRYQSISFADLSTKNISKVKTEKKSKYYQLFQEFRLTDETIEKNLDRTLILNLPQTLTSGQEKLKIKDFITKINSMYTTGQFILAKTLKEQEYEEQEKQKELEKQRKIYQQEFIKEIKNKNNFFENNNDLLI